MLQVHRRVCLFRWRGLVLQRAQSVRTKKGWVQSWRIVVLQLLQQRTKKMMKMTRTRWTRRLVWWRGLLHSRNLRSQAGGMPRRRPTRRTIRRRLASLLTLPTTTLPGIKLATTGNWRAAMGTSCRLLVRKSSASHVIWYALPARFSLAPLIFFFSMPICANNKVGSSLVKKEDSQKVAVSWLPWTGMSWHLGNLVENSSCAFSPGHLAPKAEARGEAGWCEGHGSALTCLNAPWGGAPHLCLLQSDSWI